MLRGAYSATPPTLGEGDKAELQLDDNANLKVTVEAGSASGTEYVEDAAAAANPSGPALILVRRDTPSAAEVSADGDNVAAKADRFGAMRVNAANSSLTAAAGGDGSVSTSAETITVANTVQVVEFFNLSANIIWLRWTGTAAAGATGSIPVPAYAAGVAGYYSGPPGASGSLSVIAETGASAFTCNLWS